MRVLVCLFLVILLTGNAAWSDEQDAVEFTGVVTLQLLPAKVIRINEIIEDPEPGTSFIGDAGVLMEVKENPEVTSNWSIVTASYLEYEQPKVIEYEILSEKYQITVRFHAVSLEVTGDLSDYIPQ